MKYSRPLNLRAGFHVSEPEASVPELLWAGEHWANRNYRIQYHAHPPWEFYLQVTGEACWSAGEQEYSWQPGTFFAVAPNVPHHAVERFSSKYHYLYCGLDLEPIFSRHEALREHWQNREVIHVEEGGALLEPFRALIRELSLVRPFRAPALRLAVDLLAIEATRLLQDEPHDATWLFTHPAISRACQLMDNNPGRAWKLSELARAAGLSAGNLSNRFTGETGVSPHQYLMRTRINRARQLLQQSDISITQLSAELGFSSSQHFATTFKKLVGITAREFRRQR